MRLVQWRSTLVFRAISQLFNLSTPSYYFSVNSQASQSWAVSVKNSTSKYREYIYPELEVFLKFLQWNSAIQKTLDLSLLRAARVYDLKSHKF